MTERAQIIAIAEAVGYIKPEIQPFKEDQWFSPKGTSTLFSQLPRYTTDLNAIHEAEKAVVYLGVGNYLRHGRCLIEVCPDGVYAPMFATAKQRAEALVKGLHKWDDSL